MSEPSPRQVLYALVSGGFLVVVVVLVAGSAIVGLAPGWWTFVMTLLVLLATIWSAFNWRRTVLVLLISIGLLVFWTVGTLLVR
jgi:hypothetical protein